MRKFYGMQPMEKRERPWQFENRGEVKNVGYEI